MRTNIDLDDALVEEAMRASGEKTKTAVVHRALRELVRVEGLRRMREHRTLVSWEGDLDQMRERQPLMAREPKATYGVARRHKRSR
jgi:Arc/MetJ family transcription regulator